MTLLFEFGFYTHFRSKPRSFLIVQPPLHQHCAKRAYMTFSRTKVVNFSGQNEILAVFPLFTCLVRHSGPPGGGHYGQASPFLNIFDHYFTYTWDYIYISDSKSSLKKLYEIMKKLFVLMAFVVLSAGTGLYAQANASDEGPCHQAAALAQVDADTGPVIDGFNDGAFSISDPVCTSVLDMLIVCNGNPGCGGKPGHLVTLVYYVTWSPGNTAPSTGTLIIEVNTQANDATVVKYPTEIL